MIINSLDEVKYYTYCKKCGEKVYVDTSAIYTSNPPMYQYTCPKCGNVSYVFCHDTNIEVNGNENKYI